MLAPTSKIYLKIVLAAVFIESLAHASVYFLLIFKLSSTANSWSLTAIALTSALTGVILAAPLGNLVDRMSLRPLWLGSIIVSILSVFLLSISESLILWVLLVVIYSAAGVISGSVVFKALPRIEGITPEKASSFLVSTGALVGILSPLLASLLYALAPNHSFIPLIILLAACFLIIFKAAPQGAPPELDSISWKDALLGIKVISNNHHIIYYLPIMLLVVLSTSVEDLSGVVYLQDIGGNFISPLFPNFPGDPGAIAYSALVASWSIGTLVGAHLTERKLFKLSPAASLKIGGFIISLAIFAEGFFPSPVLIAAFFFLGGAGNAVHNVGIRNLVYTEVAEKNQGQAWAMIGATFTVFSSIGQFLGTPYLLGEPQQVIMYSGLFPMVIIALFPLAMVYLRRPKINR